MSLHHQPHQNTDGRWHAVYKVPGTSVLSSIGDAPTESGAKQMCVDANKDQERKEKTAEAVHPADRRIPSGFYTDKDAA